MYSLKDCPNKTQNVIQPNDKFTNSTLTQQLMLNVLNDLLRDINTKSKVVFAILFIILNYFAPFFSALPPSNVEAQTSQLSKPVNISNNTAISYSPLLAVSEDKSSR